MRLVSNKNGSFETLRDFYISILVEREMEESKKIFKENKLWDIRHGGQFLDPGYIFAPYIPVLAAPPQIVSGDNFESVRGIMSRYANKKIDENLYGKFTIGELLR